MTTPTSRSRQLQDVLYQLSLAKARPDAELLDEFTRRYPEYSAELTDFAIELAVDAIGRDVDELPVPASNIISPAVSRAISRFQNRLFEVRRAGPTVETQSARSNGPVANPIAALDRAALRSFAKGLNANTLFVTKLRDRQIAADTMTDGFKHRSAELLVAPLDVVVAHYAAPPQLQPGSSYKSEGKPEAASVQTFEEAVRSSGLSEDQQRYLLSL